jgi:hypothetical protein
MERWNIGSWNIGVYHSVIPSLPLFCQLPTGLAALQASFV